jgi:hypothetical protein
MAKDERADSRENWEEHKKPREKTQRQGRMEKREIKQFKERTGGERTGQCSVELNLSGLLRSGAFF